MLTVSLIVVDHDEAGATGAEMNDELTLPSPRTLHKARR